MKQEVPHPNNHQLLGAIYSASPNETVSPRERRQVPNRFQSSELPYSCKVPPGFQTESFTGYKFNTDANHGLEAFWSCEWACKELHWKRSWLDVLCATCCTWAQYCTLYSH